MKDKDILDILINSTDRLTENEIETLKRLKEENKELKESELDYTSIYLSGIFDERARWEKRVKEILEKYKYTKVEEADKIIKFYYEGLKKYKEFIKDIDTDFFFQFVDYMITKNNELEGMLKHVEKFRDENLSSEIEYIIALKSSYMTYLKTNYIPKSKVKEIIYPSPENPISLEVQSSKMYKDLVRLLEE